MNSSDNTPDEVELANLLASVDREAPPPDRAFLDALRERSAAAFLPITPRSRTMKISSLRWIAAVAALLLVGVVFAQWIANRRRSPRERGIVRALVQVRGRGFVARGQEPADGDGGAGDGDVPHEVAAAEGA